MTLLRRCAVLFIEIREDLDLDLRALFSGVGALGATLRQIALAPHVGDEIELGDAELTLLGALGPTLWQERSQCEQRFGPELVERLLELGLLIGTESAYSAMRERDDALRAAYWRPLSAVAHAFSRWHDIKGENGKRFPTFDSLVASFGPPPPATIECAPEHACVDLPAPLDGPLDATLLGRYTGRNFDAQAVLPLPVAARLLQRTFGAQHQRQISPEATVLKKTSPSGGGLHPIEAYVLVQRVSGIAPGLYHYHPLRHRLEPMQLLGSEAARTLALATVADQQWFADAPMLVVMAGRVERSFWKYRDHPKSYRVLLLDAGHLSQTFYLLAAEAGLPAFITAGINEVNIEHAFGLDPLKHAVIAVCGCGTATAQASMTELRPAR
ncbi:MAG: putative peptide maturation dehydrogenase [Pseudomonadota bacterium]